MFSFKFQIKFNKSDGTHSTVCGGCISILVKVFFALYVWQLFNKLFDGGDDKIFQYSMTVDDDYNITTQSLNMVMFAYLNLYDKDGIKRNIPYDKKHKRYVIARFGTMYTNHSAPDEIH